MLTSSIGNNVVIKYRELEGPVSKFTLSVEKNGVIKKYEINHQDKDGLTIDASIQGQKQTLTLSGEQAQKIRGLTRDFKWPMMPIEPFPFHLFDAPWLPMHSFYDSDAYDKAHAKTLDQLEKYKHKLIQHKNETEQYKEQSKECDLKIKKLIDTMENLFPSQTPATSA